MSARKIKYIEGSGNYVLAYRDNSRNWKNFYRAANWTLTIEKYVTDMPDDLFSSVEEKNRILGEAVHFYWNIITGINEKMLEINLEAYNPIRMRLKFDNNTKKHYIVDFCNRYKNLLFRQTIFGR